MRRLETDLLTGAFWLFLRADKLGRGRRSLSGIYQPAVAAGTLSGERPLVSLTCVPSNASLLAVGYSTRRVGLGCAGGKIVSRVAPGYDFAEVIAKQPPPVVCCAGGKVESGSPGSSGRESEEAAKLNLLTPPVLFLR